MIRYQEVTPADWPAIEQLFGPRGACGGCWCMWWRVPQGGKVWAAMQGAPAKAQFEEGITSGMIHGVLAFDGQLPVGWCAFGPREDYPRLNRTKSYQRPAEAGVWSIPCFYITTNYRGQGVAKGLLGAAIKALKKHRARIIEAYPVTPTQAGGRLPPAFSAQGPLEIFLEAGFLEVQRIATSRPVVQLHVYKTNTTR
ncbi:MAG: GNAT family N-acetyltransferase [bacterium]